VVEQLGEAVVLGRTGTSPGKFSVSDLVTLPLRALVNLIKSLDPVSDREVAISQIEKSLKVESERESTVIVVTYDAPTPQLAQTICNAVVEVYRDVNMRIHRNEESRPFFAEQQERLELQLNESLDQLRLAKNEMGFSNVDQRQATLEAQFDAVELARLKTEQEVATTQARIDNLELQLLQVPERVMASKRTMPNQGADLLRQQLFELQIKAMDLEARYNDSHPLVEAVNAQLADAKQVLEQQSEMRSETSDDINPIYRQLLLDLRREQNLMAGGTARRDRLAQQKEAVLAELRAVNDAGLKVDQLSRKAELARDKFVQYSRSMEEARIDKELEEQNISNLSVVQAASLSEKPISPSRRMVAAAMFLLAVAGTGGLVLISERLDDRLRSEHDVEQALGVPVFATIPGDRARAVMPLKTNGQPSLVASTNGGESSEDQKI
jgi:uncharacterized protein involved in exopolysaccharide biosynthesis